MSLVAAIDQGTTSTKGLLVRSDGSAEKIGSIKHRQIIVPANDELTAYGAALLANRGITPLNSQKETTEPEDSGNIIEWRERFSVARSKASGWRRI